MHDSQILSFELELIKLGGPAQMAQAAKKLLGRAAKSPAIQRGLGGVGSGAGVGGAAGAALGAGAGGVKAYREAREQGASGGEAALAGLGGAVGGGVKGGVGGALLGGAALGGLAAKGVAPNLAGRLAGAPGPIGASARFGQRQVHSMTGWTPRGYGDVRGIREMRAGSYGSSKSLAEARKKGSTKDSEKARKVHEASQKAEEMGLTSLPGYAKALAKNPGKTLKTGIGEQWNSGLMGKAFVAAPAAVAAKELATEGEPGGPGRLQRAGEALGGLAYAAGPIPLVGSTLAGGAISSALGTAGRLGDKATGKKKKKRPENPAPPSLEPAGGDATVDEYIYSPAAADQRPEIGGGL